MPGINESILRIHEQKESFEGLKVNPKLISLDGPDGVGKTTIATKIVELLKEEAIKNNEDPSKIIYVKTIKYVDTKSQELLRNLIRKNHDLNHTKKSSDFEYLAKLWAARANRSYHDHILPDLSNGKTIIMDRSELDILRGSIEWGEKMLAEKIKKYYKEGTITNGITAGNRIFIDGSPEDMWTNLTSREKELTHNDPKSLDEMRARLLNEKKAEEEILKIPVDGTVNVIRKTNVHTDNTLAQAEQVEKIAQEIISQLKLK